MGTIDVTAIVLAVLTMVSGWVTYWLDRDRIRSKADVRSKKEVARVERDTVYVERKDSILVKSEEFRVKSSLDPRPSSLILTLKWILAIAFLLLTSVVLVRARH